MFPANFARACALAALATTAAASPARADIRDYEFRLVETQFKTGRPVVAVRLVHKPDERPVSGAVIFCDAARHGARGHGEHDERYRTGAEL
jgi:hypothetical protein